MSGEKKPKWKYMMSPRPPVRGKVGICINEEITPPERALAYLDAAVRELTDELACYAEKSERHDKVQGLLDETRRIKDDVEDYAGKG